MDKDLDTLLAENLLSINAIKLQPDSPFSWATGWNSPIYTDLRMSLSYPRVRNLIKVEMSRLIMENFGDADVIAGIATGAIAHGARVADSLSMPFVYVRNTPKDHGLENSIEGNLVLRQKVVIVEDVVIMGANALKAIDTVIAAGCEVIGAVTIFSFEFTDAVNAFRDAGITLVPMTTYHELVDVAYNIGWVSAEEVEVLRKWHNDPKNWVPAPLVD